MTIKLYDTDAYCTDFQATVISCEKCSEQKMNQNRYELILDQTCFFPEEGGQTPDRGTINGIEVCDVQIQKDGTIIHYIEETAAAAARGDRSAEADGQDVFVPGSPVAGQIYWQERYSNMQQHSGEHIMSGLIHDKYGYHNVGFHLSQNEVTMDFDGTLSRDQLDQIEDQANRAIYKNLDILAEYPTGEVLAELKFRSKIEIDGPVRIVTIPGYDCCACCAPHVRRTGEIGIIKVQKVTNYKSGVRVSILCGRRALEDYRAKNVSITAISGLLSANADSVTDAVRRLQTDNASLKSQIAELQNQMVQQKAAAIPAGSDNLCLFEAQLESIPHRNLVNLLTARCTGTCGVFVGNDTDGYRYIIGSTTGDVRGMNQLLKEKCGARGGGSAEMVQGSLTGTQDQIKELFSALNK